jgi:hypothetical protein
MALLLLFVRVMKTNERGPDRENLGVQKDPDDWKTGDEPMTPAQRSYLETLARDTGEPIGENLTKAEASKRIDELRGRSPRVQND